MIKWNFGKSERSKAAPINRGFSAGMVGNQVVIYPTPDTYIQDAYQANDLFYSIVKLISNKICLPEWGVYIIKDEKKYRKFKSLYSSLKSATGINGIYQEALYTKDQAVERVSDSKLDKLLKYPNDNQTWDDLLTEACIYYNSTGNIYQAATLLSDGANQGKPQRIFTLPSPNVVIKADGLFPASALEYRFRINAQEITYSPAEVLHLKLVNPDYSLNGSQLYGMSPLQAARYLVSRTNESTKSGATAFKNMGAGGYMVLDDSQTDPDKSIVQMQLLKDQYNKNHYHEDNKGGTLFSHLNLKYIPIGMSPADLKIIESEKWDLTRFCNVFGVPTVLMNPERAIQNNMKEAEKSLTTRAAIPFLDMYRDGLNRKLENDWNNKEGRFIDYDPSCFYELQDDMVEKTTWLNNAWGITLKERLEGLGMSTDGLSEEELNKRYVPSNLTELSEVGLNGQMSAADAALNKSGLNDYKL